MLRHGRIRSGDLMISAGANADRGVRTQRGRHLLAIAIAGVTILLGNGAGDFTEAAGSPHTAPNATDVVAADFDQDSNQDLAVQDRTNSQVTILLGNGSGGFSPAATSPESTQSSPDGIAI